MTIAKRILLGLSCLGFILLLLVIFNISIFNKNKIAVEHTAAATKKNKLYSLGFTLTTDCSLAFMDSILRTSEKKISGEIQEKFNNFKNFIEQNKQEFSSDFKLINAESTFIEGQKAADIMLHEGQNLFTDISTGSFSVENMREKYDEVLDENAAKVQDMFSKILEKSDATEQLNREALIEHMNWANLANYISGILAFICFITVSIISIGSINKALLQLENMLSQSTQQIVQESHHILSVSEELSSSFQEQAASVHETVSSLDEISALVNLNALAAEESLTEMKELVTLSTDGSSTVDQMNTSMTSIVESNTQVGQQIDNSHKQIERITELIKEIAVKTQVINDIVFQTKLLSFNASVEAARAGETGKGFAVVAEEVGNLARMSGTAATDINSIVHKTIIEVQSIVNESKNSIAKKIQQSAQALDQGGSEVTKTSDYFSKIKNQKSHRRILFQNFYHR